MQFIIKHIDSEQYDQPNAKLPAGKPKFIVTRASDNRNSESPIALTPPDEVIVGETRSNLVRELTWYFEDYLEIPLNTYKKRADMVVATLKQWGMDMFDALFGDRITGRMYDETWITSFV